MFYINNSVHVFIYEAYIFNVSRLICTLIALIFLEFRSLIVYVSHSDSLSLKMKAVILIISLMIVSVQRGVTVPTGELVSATPKKIIDEEKDYIFL